MNNMKNKIVQKFNIIIRTILKSIIYIINNIIVHVNIIKSDVIDLVVQSYFRSSKLNINTPTR